MLNCSDLLPDENIKPEMIIEDLQRTEIGRETLEVIENLPERIKLTYGEYSTGVRVIKKVTK